MNFENASDIIFVHKMDASIEKQVIGRAQRMGRKDVLNIIYLEHENESIYVNKKINSEIYNYENDELNDYFNTIQYNNIINNLSNIDLKIIDNNIDNDIDNDIDIDNNNGSDINNNQNINHLKNINLDMNIADIPKEIIDVNLDELIKNLE